MTQVVTMQRNRDRRIIKRGGGNTRVPLRLYNTGESSDLRLLAPASAGATALSTSGQGLVRRGAAFTVAGVSGAYTTATDAAAVNGAVSLTFAPPLAGPAAGNAAVTWTRAYGEWMYLRMMGAQNNLNVREVAEGTAVYVLAWEATMPPPEGAVGSSNTLDGYAISNVKTIGSGAPSRYEVTVITAGGRIA